MTSEQAHPKTIRDRSAFISNVRHLVSGGEPSSQAQIADELCQTNPQSRREILKEAGFNVEHTIPPSAGLALKADLNIPWNKLRHLRRYMEYHSRSSIITLYLIVHIQVACTLEDTITKREEASPVGSNMVP